VFIGENAIHSSQSNYLRSLTNWIELKIISICNLTSWGCWLFNNFVSKNKVDFRRERIFLFYCIFTWALFIFLIYRCPSVFSFAWLEGALISRKIAVTWIYLSFALSLGLLGVVGIIEFVVWIVIILSVIFFLLVTVVGGVIVSEIPFISCLGFLCSHRLCLLCVLGTTLYQFRMLQI
jgi:hypothetical protein